ncbi:MAG: hypothetical protein HOP13_20475 [Alphaproteobacteria bacterium]|nr:hypothetical protein [Alphaproteobacteria bacterium]
MRIFAPRTLNKASQVTDKNPQEEPSVRSAVLYWWVALGSIGTGVSIVSLLRTYLKRDLEGVAGLVVEKYAQLRDIVFDALQQAIPLVHLTTEQRSYILALLIFGAVYLRTLSLARRKGASGDDVLFPILTLVYFGIVVAMLLPPMGEVPEMWFFALGILGVIAFLAYVDARARVSIQYFLINAVACIIVAVVLLGLGGAF